MKRLIFVFVALTFGLMACKKEDTDAAMQLTIDKKIIENYLAEKGLSALSTSSGLYYIIEKPGNEEKPTVRSEVTVRYTGKFTNGSVFDNGGGQAISFPLANVIEGWKQGIPLFGKGGKGVLLIPSALGYGTKGERGTITIAPNTVLIFDIDLISFHSVPKSF